ncbi:MAG: hypothetical protein IPL53_09765 [Ignavibacteria bacterium]|nr:hypothetical protein [Ignavibacteria bacterium]
MISFKSVTVFILIISGLAFTFFTPLNYLINFAHDDSFFYIKAALNYSLGFGSTFDRVNITNGYHPLWFLFLALYYFLLNSISSFSTEYIYRFTVLLQIIISASTLYFISKLFRANNDVSNYKKKYFLFIPLYIILVFTRDFGMESQLACLLFSIYCFLKSEELYRQKNFAVLKSLLLCLLFLTRTDYLFSIVPFMILFDYYTSDRKIGLRQLMISTVMLTFTAVSYFLFNKMTYGYFLTISAVSKNTFPELIFIQNMENLVSSGPMLIHFLKSVCILFAISLFLFSKKNTGVSGRVNVFLFGSVCGSFLFILFNFCFNTHGLREWYITFP